MNKTSKVLLLALIFPFLLSGQMTQENGDVLYGHEWIDFNQSYYKIKLAEDGVYRVSYDELIAAGIPLNNIDGDQLQLISLGKEIPIRTSTESSWSSNDFFEFYGEKNRAQLDKHLYSDWENQMLNDEYSLFNDTMAYYLTWATGGNNLRIQEADNNLNGTLPQKEPYYIHKEQKVFSNVHFKPTHGQPGDNARFSHFDLGEGYGSSLKKSNKVTLNHPFYVNTGPSPRVSFRTGSNRGNHTVQFRFNNNLLDTDTYVEYHAETYDLPLSAQDLSGNSSELEILGTNDNFDRNILAHATLSYAREFSFDNSTSWNFSIGGGFSNKYVEIENFNAGQNPIIYDLDNHLRYEGDIDANTIRLFLSSDNNVRNFHIYNNDEGVKSISSIEQKEMVDFSTMDPNYIILTSKRLNNADGGNNIVSEYSNYRSSQEGGNHNVGIVEVEDLYELYGYGIERHSIALRNFGQHMFTYWSNPNTVFILGKGREYSATRTFAQLTNEDNQSYYIPTFGSPGSDNLIFTHPDSLTARVSIGRLAAKNSTDIQNYLDKVLIYEDRSIQAQEEEQLWQKRIIHLSGGDATLQSPIKIWLASMEQVIENNNFGGEVFTFEKTSSDPLQTSVSAEILNLINSGTNLLTFFGHSAVGTFDFSIEDPDKYDNYGKYPIITSLGCYSGDIHSSNEDGLSETFVMEKDKAAIAFLASAGTAYVNAQATLGHEFYRQIGENAYGSTLGEVLKISLLNTHLPTTLENKTLTEQFTLHGDPALQLYSYEGPDYTFDRSKTSVNPSIISSSTDSIDLVFDIINLGKNINDSLDIFAEVQLPNSEIIALDSFRILAPSVRTTHTLRVPIFEENSIGYNTIRVTLDGNDEILELPTPQAEQNNELTTLEGNEGFQFYVSSNDLRPFYPKEFSIVNQNDITLIAGTSNPFFELQSYVIEIDTTETFDSPLKLSKEGEQQGGLIKWKPEINFENNVVYYWRITPVISGVDLRWRNSSFVYLSNSSEGWNQSHYYQFLDDDLTTMKISEEHRILEFADNLNSVPINVGQYPNVTPTINIDNNPFEMYDFGGWPNAGITVAVFDRFSGLAVKNPYPGAHGSDVAGDFAVNWKTFPYHTGAGEQTSRGDLINFLDNTIEDGQTVVVYTMYKNNTDFNPEDWEADAGVFGKSIFDVLEEEGANQIRELKDLGSRPYLFIYRKGDPNYARQEFLVEENEEIEYTLNVVGKWDRGSVLSSEIGPSSNWDKVFWDLENVNVTEDEFSLNVYGIKDNNTVDLIFEDQQVTEIDISNINASVYSKLKLELVLKDSIQRTSPNLNYWRVLYDGIPEGALNPQSNFVFNKDTLQQGETLSLELSFENISEIDMDSIYVKYTIQKSDNSLENVFKRFDVLPSLGTVKLDFDYDSRLLSGDNILTIEANPFEDQPELFHFNNIGQLSFYVEKDKRNPLLDVTFDGIRILDGDIVSKKPFIRMELKDENQFFLLNDITLFELALESPSGLRENIDLGSADIEFIPATTNAENYAVLTFNPDLQEEGLYKLYVQAKDPSENFSGQNEYEVNFRVILSEKISNVFNYPNPFSSSTQFIFTLTGEEVPESFAIQIYTVSGKVVKQITKEELGPLHIGLNKTDYKWEGTDDFGQKLANGVYLYKVISTKSDGSSYEKYDTGTDQFFNSGFGKMVIMR